LSRVIGLLSSIVLARLLVPEDFGLLALGLTLTTVIGLTSTVGFGAAIIRRPEEPERTELQAVMALQLVAVGVALVIMAGLIPIFGKTVAIGFVMVSALPISALRLPDTLVLERHLGYAPIAKVELSEVLVQSVLSVVLVVAGAGVWGVAVASPLRALVGTLLMWRLGPVGPTTPRWSTRHVRVLAGEGTIFAAHGAIALVRDQGTNIAIGALGGLGALGAWSLSGRLMAIPGVVLAALWQVGFPAMSRMEVESGREVDHIARTLALTAVGLGLPLAVVIGSSQTLVPVLFGPGWDAAAATLPWIAAGFLVAGPVSVALGSALYAARRGGVIVKSSIANAVASFLVLFLLYDEIGLPSAGVAVLVSGLVEVVVLGYALKEDCRRYLSVSIGPLLATLAGASAGILVSEYVGDTLGSLILVVIAIAATTSAACFVLARAATTELLRLARTAVHRSARTKS